MGTSEAGASSHDGSSNASRELLRASSEASVGATSSIGAPVTDQTQLLRLETIKDSESRRVIMAMKLSTLLGVIGATALGVIKETRGRDKIVMNRSFVIAQICCFGVMLLALLAVFSAWAGRIVQSRRKGMIWSKRRIIAVQATAIRGAVILVIAVGQFVLNVHLLADPGSFCTSRVIQPLVNTFVWVGWNTLLCLLVIDSHNTNLRPTKERSDGTVRDEPIWFHWPKLLIWVPTTAVVVWIAIMGAEDGHTVHTQVVKGGNCTWGAELKCEISDTLYAGTILFFVGTGLYFVTYAYFLVRSWRQLSGQLYQKYRILNMAVRLQFRFNGSMVLSLMYGIALTWYLGSDACVNYAVTWYGNPPVTFIIICFQLVSFNLTFPRRHNALATQHALPTGLLQQFAWTEADVPRKLSARLQAVDSACAACPNFLAKPLFCFETAIKLFFWSTLVYSYTETSGVSFETMPAPIKALIGEMDAAMRLFNLSKRHLFYDRSLGTKVLVAWNSSTILVTVRGTAEMINVLADAKFLQTAHPPRRRYKGRTPRVHRGFLSTWEANGTRTRVLAHISALLDSADDRSAVRVLCTGHSLGGAVAQLVSFDIARELGVSPRNIKVYTYGCPRIGNHALAEESYEMVPDTWHIINDQDLVTRILKLFGLYKRAGQRVIVNRRGDLIVRPNLFELSMMQNMRGGTASHHLTVEYQNALVAIITAQLKASSRYSDGLHGLLGLLKEMPQVRMALEVHAKQLGTSLVDLVRTAAHSSETFRSATFSPSLRFTPSRHASLLRATGSTAETPAGAAAAAVAAVDGIEPGSPASGASVEVVPVAVLDEEAEGGDEPSMQVEDGLREPDPVEPSEEGHAPEESDTMAAARRLQRWRSATNKARAAVRLSRSGQDGAASPEDTKDPLIHEVAAKYCYPIPERAGAAEEHGGSGGLPGQGRARRKQKKQCKWRCPLSCRPEELPEGAKLHGCLLDIGEAPDMKSCKGTWAGGGVVGDPRAVCQRQNSRRGGGEAAAAAGTGTAQAVDVRVNLTRGDSTGPDAVSGAEGTSTGSKEAEAGGEGGGKGGEGPRDFPDVKEKDGVDEGSHMHRS
eukprot:jgi/Ulvmu1/3612/UM017_0024.1